MGSASGIIGLTFGIIVVVFIFTFVVLRKSGALGMTKKKREQAQQLVQTGVKARATILQIQPTGTVINNINLQCVVTFRLEPLQGGQPFDVQKKMLLAQTSMPRIGDMWPSWFDRTDPSQFAVGQPNALTNEQVALFHEFGIPHPFDRR